MTSQDSEAGHPRSQGGCCGRSIGERGPFTGFKFQHRPSGLRDTVEKVTGWRDKASEARRLAQAARGSFQREHLLRVAESYEIVAQDAERRMLGTLGVAQPAQARFNETARRGAAREGSE